MKDQTVTRLDAFTTFGDLLRYLRVRAQLTQHDLSIAVDYSEAQISRLESNKRAPNPDALRALFVPALGLEEKPEVVARLLALAEQVRGPGPVEFPPGPEPPESLPKSAFTRKPHNLPGELTSLIGREAELGEIARLLERPATRLLTLTGAGGCGKTRLALRTGRNLAASYPDGAWLVELAPLSDPYLVPQTVISSLELVTNPNQPPEETLAAFLESRKLLLILDNCEHLVEAVAQLALAMLSTCPGLQILATSREPLGIPGEITYRVPSLALPSAIDSTAITQYPAGQLFVERAASIQPDFTLAERDAPALARICRLLDGIPLAIELAAARVRMMTVEQISDRLGDTFLLLTGGSRMGLPRHRTLRACIDWSYMLLSPAERTLLLRLAVFAGGWTLEAAERVCADTEDHPSIQAEPVADLLGRLIDKSLVQYDPSAGKEPRYRMLETLRQYAGERLAGEQPGKSGEHARLRERHLDYFLWLAQQAEPHLRARQARYWLDRLHQDLDNLRLALEWSLAGSVDKGLQMATSLLWFWRMHHPFWLEGMKWLNRLLDEQTARPGILDIPGKAARGRACRALYDLAGNSGNQNDIPQSMADAVLALCEEGMSLFQELYKEQGEPYRRDYAIARHLMASTLEENLECRQEFLELNERFWLAGADQAIMQALYLEYADYERISFYSEEALAICREIGDVDGEAYTLYLISFYERWQGNLAKALASATEGAALFEEVGNLYFACVARDFLWKLSFQRGDCDEANRQADQILALGKLLNDRQFISYHPAYSGWVAWEKGDYEQAVRCSEEAMRLNRDVPPNYRRIEPDRILTRVAFSRGETAQARKYLENLSLHEPFSAWGYIELGGCYIELVGELAAWENQFQQSATLFGAQSSPRNWRNNFYSPRTRGEHEKALARTRAALSEEAFTAAWNAGLAMPGEQAMQYAREYLEEKD